MSETKYRTTPLAVSVHPEGQNPVFGECATHIRIEDDAAGPFIVLNQHHDLIKPGEVRFDLEELERVVVAARELMAAQPKEIAE